MNIDPELEGLWQLTSDISDGRESYPEPWHYLFREGLYKEIVPDLVDDGTLRCTYKTNVLTRSRQLEITLDYKLPNGRSRRIVQRGVYEVAGDELRITFGLDDEFPAGLTDAFPYSVKTYRRDLGPVPESRKPSGTPPINHDKLGRLVWDDNFASYSGMIAFNGHSVVLHLYPPDVMSTDRVVQRAMAIAKNDRHYSDIITRYAVDGLLAVKNGSWLEGDQPEATRRDFTKSMTLESISVYDDGRVEFWHDDGGLFRGHSIQVVIDQGDRCTLTDIRG